METKEKTTNREQALQERMKAETERIVGENKCCALAGSLAKHEV